MRARLLEATVECLAEDGYEGSSAVKYLAEARIAALPDPTTPELRDALELSIDAMRGLAMRRVLLGARETEAQWRRHRRLILELPEG